MDEMEEVCYPTPIESTEYELRLEEENARLYREKEEMRESVLRTLFPESPTSGLMSHARLELELAGLFDTDSDYNGMLGNAVLDLMRVFAVQGHFGFSASMVVSIFTKLAKYEPLSPLTDNPDEWNDICEAFGNTMMWQSRRNPECFSEDGGKTYTCLSEGKKVFVSLISEKV